MSISIYDVLSDENLLLAKESFQGKRDSCGMDGIKVSMLDDYWDTNGEKIKQAIINGRYSMGVVQLQDIVNSKGKSRTISLMNTIDRFIYRALMQVIAEVWDPLFSDSAFAYREHTGVNRAAEQAASYIEQGNTWVIELDVQDFFDNIRHDILLEKVWEEIEDPQIQELLLTYLKCTVMDDHIYYQKEKGIVQGGPLSPLLSNIYMNDLDHYMEEHAYLFCRFGDDLNIYCQSYEQAFEQYQDVKRHIEECEMLALNMHKTGVYKALNRKYLGYRFEEKSGEVIAKKERKSYRTVYRDWYTTGIERVDKNYHLINEGVITKRDYTLLFEGKNGKRYIPVETTDSLYIYSNVIFSGSFFELVNSKGLNVSMIDRYGEKVGSFVPQNNRRNIKTELKQLKLYENEKERLALAKKLEIASVSNLRANLRYYERRKPSDKLQETVEYISVTIQQLNEAKDITCLMTLEAQARQKYYHCFNVILEDKDFRFEKRTRRPPEDPLNAMISFGNTLLYQRIANEINRTSLDIRIGIVHAAGSRPESLNLDLADIFKPIIVDRTIFTLVNRKMLDMVDFVEVENNGIYLSGKGKKIFIREFERKLYQKIQMGNMERTYDFVIKNEIQCLKRHIERGEKYKPYKYT